MPGAPHAELSRRERQIFEAVYRLGRATVAEVRAELPDPPSYSAVRTTLGLLKDKGYLRHEQDGPRYVYLARVPRKRASRSALRDVVRTFFGGSREAAMAALLDLSDEPLNEAELAQLSELVRRARESDPGEAGR
jgi:BlaI family transcriptional regulator, penicillinase repressor